jgi:hypothetical protein
MADNSLRERERMRGAMPRALRDRRPLTDPSWTPPARGPDDEPR